MEFISIEAQRTLLLLSLICLLAVICVMARVILSKRKVQKICQQAEIDHKPPVERQEVRVAAQQEDNSQQQDVFCPESTITRNTQDYRNLYLHPNPVKDRETMYIHRHIIDSMRGYLGVIGPRISLTAYINNILDDHLSAHSDEINKLYDENIRRNPVNLKR